jgi:hypothetical protein
MIQLCSDIGGDYVQGMALASILKETLCSSKGGVCYNCKKTGHFAKECHKGTKADAPPTGPFSQGQKPTGICKHGCHWDNECHSQTTVEGQPLQG